WLRAAHRCAARPADPPRSYPDHERRQLSAQAIRRQPPSCHLDERGGAKPGQRRNGQSSRCPCSRSGLSLNHPTKSHRPLATALLKSALRERPTPSPHWPAFTPLQWPGFAPPLTAGRLTLGCQEHGLTDAPMLASFGEMDCLTQARKPTFRKSSRSFDAV